MSKKLVRITTIDNPFDPFEDFELWFKYDESCGYHTCGYLARIANVSSSLSEEDNLNEINRAIDEIISFNGTEFYKKVEKEIE